jgi:hypothetical protein
MFESITAFLATLGINPAQLFAGLAGAFTRTVIQKQPLTLAVIATSIVGALCAVYLTPIIGLWLGLNMSLLAVNNALSFAIGLIGMSLAEGLVTMAQNWAKNPRLMRTMDAKGIADAVNDHTPTAEMKKPDQPLD